MDLLFKRYASPYLILDVMIETGRLSDFITELIGSNEEEKLWELYLNTIYVNKKSFEEFLKSAGRNEDDEQETQVNLEATIDNTKNILNNFKKPSKQEVNKVNERI